MPFKISELTSDNAEDIFEKLDAGRGHTVERHGNLEYGQLVARRISEATCWIHAQDAIAALKEIFQPAWQVQTDLLNAPNCRKHVLDTGTDWTRQVKIRVVEQTKGVAGVKAKEGTAKVSVICVFQIIRDDGGRSPASTVDIVTMYPKLLSWIDKPKDF